MWIATIACVAAARSSDVPTVSSDGADLVLAAAPGGRIILSTINEKGVCAYVDLRIFFNFIIIKHQSLLTTARSSTITWDDFLYQELHLPRRACVALKLIEPVLTPMPTYPALKHAVALTCRAIVFKIKATK